MTWEIRRRDAAGPLDPRDVGQYQLILTSPPYFGLRDYSAGGESPVPPTDWPEVAFIPMHGLPPVTVPALTCRLGEEPDPLTYTAHLLHVCRGLRPLLRDDGLFWLNLGDSYARNPKKGDNRGYGKHAGIPDLLDGSRKPTAGLREGNLFGIPWRAAFALQADGWIIRAGIPWIKRNAKPDSTPRRPSYSHEDVFMLAKTPGYFSDMYPVRRPAAESTTERDHYTRITAGKDGDYSVRHDHETPSDPAGRHWRTGDFLADGLLGDEDGPLALNVPLQPYRGAHFAPFPPRLVEPIVRFSTSDKGCCPACGTPRVRVVDHSPMVIRRSGRGEAMGEFGRTQPSGTVAEPTKISHLGWQPGCSCPPAAPVPCRILDPFAGAGTTLVVGDALGRHAVGWEVNPEYVADIRHRLERPHAPPRRVSRVAAPAGPSLFPEEP